MFAPRYGPSSIDPMPDNPLIQLWKLFRQASYLDALPTWGLLLGMLMLLGCLSWWLRRHFKTTALNESEGTLWLGQRGWDGALLPLMALSLAAGLHAINRSAGGLAFGSAVLACCASGFHRLTPADLDAARHHLALMPWRFAVDHWGAAAAVGRAGRFALANWQLQALTAAAG
jgi:hypothetical protein